MLPIFALAVLAGQTRPVVGPGSLISTGKSEVICPLEHTKVNADIAGFGARVTVVQTFTNPSEAPIEAIYTFPLPTDAAVDRMTMKIGDRVISGIIKRREEARLMYEAAKNQGKAAALLDQERPNIFTQSVANVLPHSKVQIEISYVQLVKYEKGTFEFNFPMVVGPRFLGNAQDPDKISPPIVAKGTRSGTDVELTATIDAGAPIKSVNSVLHQVSVANKGASRVVVSLQKKDEIPNRDFILRYGTATDSVQSAFLAKYDPVKGGYFSLVLLPPKAPTQQQIAPKQVIFVMDQSGSQSGFPIEKSKELTLKLIQKMNPGDTFNVLGFANGVNYLWKEPQPNTAANREAAREFVSKLNANGGTQLRAAVDAALSQPDDPRRVKLVVFNTDGFVGDEKAILFDIREHRKNSRMFTFGIGNSVNRYLIDAMSEEGRGDSEIVTLAESADGAVGRFVERTQNPILTGVTASFEGVDVMDVLPGAIPDVFSEKPILVFGRYDTPGQGTLTLRGTMAGQPWSQTLRLTFPSDRPGGESIPILWARRMVDKLTRESALRLTGDVPQEGVNKIVDLALEYGIMTQYTSFVAVEQRVINVGGKQRTVRVPVEMADGVSYDMGVERVATAGRGGGGGFGGGQSAAPPSTVAGAPALHARESLKQKNSFLSYDASDNSFVTSEADLAKLSPAERAKVLAERKQFLFEQKVAKPLRAAKGKVAVQIWLRSVGDDVLKALAERGFKVDAKDGGLKVVFGECDAALLAELAQLQSVNRIEPLD